MEACNRWSLGQGRAGRAGQRRAVEQKRAQERGREIRQESALSDAHGIPPGFPCAPDLPEPNGSMDAIPISYRSGKNNGEAECRGSVSFARKRRGPLMRSLRCHGQMDDGLSLVNRGVKAGTRLGNKVPARRPNRLGGDRLGHGGAFAVYVTSRPLGVTSLKSWGLVSTASSLKTSSSTMRFNTTSTISVSLGRSISFREMPLDRNSAGM